MKYIDVTWNHESSVYPIRLISEVGADNFETRKLEFFSDGTVGIATGNQSSKTTLLGTDVVPSIDEINSEPLFVAKVITQEEFDKLWEIHVVNGI